MTLLKTALMDLKKNIVMNFITILEMTAAIIILIIMISSILIRYEYYAPFKDLFESKGIYCEFSPAANSNVDNNSPLSDYVHDDDIFEFLNSPDNIATCNFVMANILENPEDDESILENYAFAYNDELISRFPAKIKEGRWLNTSENAETIEVVVSQNDYGWEVGDKLSCLFYNYPEMITIDVEVVGILEENSRVAGYSAEHTSDVNYNVFFPTFSFEIEEQPVIIFSSEYIFNLDIPVDIIGGIRSAIITYPEDVSDEELKEDQKTLSSMRGVYSINLEKLDINSKNYLYAQIYNLLPIIIVILILTFVSSISNTALSTRRRLHDYAIYYIVGLQWKHCTIINFIQSLVITIISVILSFIGLYAVESTVLGDSIKVIWNSWTLISVIALMLIYLIISMIMPLVIIGKNTPKQVLTR